MTPLRSILAAGALLAFLSPAASAAQEPAGAGPQAEPAKPASAAPVRKLGKLRVFRGSVVSVDPAARKVVVKDDQGAVKEFVTDDKTRLTRGGARKKLALSGIKAGDAALVFFDGESVEKIHVAVRPKPAPARKP